MGYYQNYTTLLDTGTAGTYSFTLDTESVVKATLVGGGGAAAMRGVYDDRGYGWTGGSGAAYSGSFVLPAGTYTVVVGSANNNNKAQGGNTNTMNPADTSTHDSYITGVVRVGGGGSGYYSPNTVGAAGAVATFEVNPLRTFLSSAGKAGSSGSGGKGSGANWTHNGGDSVYNGYGHGQGCSTSEYAARRYWIAGTGGYAKIEAIAKSEYDESVKSYDMAWVQYRTLTINTDPADAVVTIDGEVTNSKRFKKWTTVDYKVERDGYRTETGSVKLKDSVELDVSMLKICTLTINPTPADSVVTINGEVRNSVTLVEGSEVSWSVSADGYEEQNGTVVLSEDTVVDVVLEEFKGPMVFVAIGYLSNSGTGSVKVSNLYAHSKDGINWTRGYMPSSQYWDNIVFGNGKFLAFIGDKSTYYVYSEDGINWTSGTLPVAMVYGGATFGAGKFVAVAANSQHEGGYTSNVCIYSKDGITWNSSTLPAKLYWSDVAYGNGKFVAISSGNVTSSTNNSSVATDIYAYSDDGINWTQGKLPTSSYWYNALFGNGKFIVTGNNSYAYSEDGINWTSGTVSLGAITYGNGKFVGVAAGNKAYYSEDGINWTTTPAPLDELTSLGAVTYGNGKFVAVGEGFKATINYGMYSEDGINWVKFTLPDSQYWYDVCFG